MRQDRVDAVRVLREFKIELKNMTIHDWVGLDCEVLVTHMPTTKSCVRRFKMHKDDHVFVREGISGQRVDFQQDDPLVVAECLLSNARLRFPRRPFAAMKRRRLPKVGILIAELPIVNWDRDAIAFVPTDQPRGRTRLAAVQRRRLGLMYGTQVHETLWR